MTSTIKKWIIVLYLTLVGCASVSANSQKSEIVDYVIRAEKTDSIDEKLYLYKKALVIDSNYVDALIGRGSAYNQKGITANAGYNSSWRSSSWFKEKAIIDLNHAIELSPNSASAYHARGVAYQYFGKPKEVLADFNKAIQLDPNNPQFYLSRSYTYRDKKEYNLRLADIDMAITLNNKFIDAHLAKASFFAGQQYYERAMVEFNEAIRINPNNSTTYSTRAYYYDQQGMTREAISDYSKAIELAPFKPLSYARRADLYRKIGEKKMADEDEIKSLNLKPANSRLNGVVSQADGAMEAFLVAINKIIENNPWDFSYYMFRGRAYAQQGDYKKAVIDLNRAVEIGVDMPDPFIIRSMVYGETGRYDEAIADLKRACDVSEGKCDEYKKALKSIVPYRGQVVDTKTRKPIADAYIVLKRTAEVRDVWSGNTSLKRDYGSQYAITDAQGRFEIPSLSKRPVLPDLMGRETVTYVLGVYHPKYSSSCKASLENTDNIFIELHEYPARNTSKLESYFPRNEKIELRKEDFQKAITMLKNWELMVGENTKVEIKAKIKELQMHVNNTTGEYRGYLYDTHKADKD